MKKTSRQRSEPIATDNIRRRVILTTVENQPGVLARVVGVFSGRGWNKDFVGAVQHYGVEVETVHSGIVAIA